MDLGGRAGLLSAFVGGFDAVFTPYIDSVCFFLVILLSTIPLGENLYFVTEYKMCVV